MSRLIPSRALPEWTALADALEHHAPPCATTDPEAWVSDHASERELAADACHDCPAMAPCHAYATAAGEDWGVWGGVDRSTLPKRKRTA